MLQSGQLTTVLLVAINVVISLWAFSRYESGRPTEDFLFVPYDVRQGRNLRGALLSHFSHADTAHLIFNMITLYSFGLVVEGMLGPASLLTIYVLSGVGANLATFATHSHDPGYRALGASGSVSGVLFAAIVLKPDLDLYLIFLPIPIPGPIFAVAYVLLSIYAAKRQMGNIGHEAHLGGALTGFLLAGARVGFGQLFGRMGGPG